MAELDQESEKVLVWKMSPFHDCATGNSLRPLC